MISMKTPTIPNVIFRCCILSWLIISTYTSSVPSSELTALKQFFFATNGPNWANKNGWESLQNEDGPTDPCSSGLNAW
jgi:hypothetical protein